MRERGEELGWADRARGGDPDAFRPLYERYFPRVYGTLYQIVQNAATAEELAQAAMVQAWRRLDQFDGRSAFGTWLHRIAVNLALDHLRRPKNRPHESLDEVLLQGREPSVGPEAEQRVSRKELGRAIQRALSKLSAEHRAVFVLGEIEQRDYAEIAQILNCKRGTVMSRMHYARLHLQRLLKGWYDTHGS
jgi:RNA polymerase sigma-70 factor (ECF subfamily)